MFGFSGSKAFGLASVLMLVFAGSAIAQQPRVGLGTAESFAVLAGSEITNTGPTVILGDVGVSPGSAVGDFSGAPQGTVFGTTYTEGAAAPAKSALTTAYNDAAGRIPRIDVPSGELGGSTLTPGVYNASSTLGLTGNVTLNGQGNPNAVFIFQVDSGLTTATDSSVSLIGLAQACNVYWQIGSSATLGTRTSFKGTIMAADSITLDDAVVVEGRLLAQTAAVTMINDTVVRSQCAAATTPPSGTPSGGGGPTTPATGPGGSSGGDNTGPSTRITGPSGVFGPPSRRTTRPRVGGDCVKRNFTTSVRLRDSAGIRNVKVYLDGKRVKQTKRTRFSLRIKVRNLSVGSHRITVVARDRAGNRSATTRRFGRCALALVVPRFTPRFTG